MFTGLVEDRGNISAVVHGADSSVLTIRTSLIDDISVGDSISVNGVCLTATKVKGSIFTADVMVQTLRLTSLGELREGDAVNLERATRADGRLGGHIVQGHVDGIATIVSIKPEERWTRMDLTIPTNLSQYIVNQGSITLDGVSLTVGEINDQRSTVTVWLIPETLSKTNLSSKKVGEKVNIEVDILAKYVERLLARRDESK